MISFSLALCFAIVATIAAQECDFCPGGELPLNGDIVIFEDFGIPFTCNDAVEQVKNSTVEDCRYIFDQGYAFFCGCPGVEAGSCPGLCPDGSNITSPEEEYFGITCAVLDQVFKGVRNESICIQNDSFYAEARSICGCKTVYCQPCLDSNVPYDFLQVSIPLPDETVTTCGDFETTVVDLNATQCSMIQDMIGAQCGCPAERCTICPGGEILPIFTDPFQNFTELGFTCYIANIDLVEEYQPNCTDQTESGLPFICGCPNAELPSDAVGCTLCADGNLDNPNLTPFNNSYTCESLDFLLSVVNQSTCKVAQSSEEAYLCGCPGVEAPTTPGPPIAVTMSPSGMDQINNIGGMGGMGGVGMGGGGSGGMGGGGSGGGGMGGVSNQGMGMMTMMTMLTMPTGRQLRSGSLLNIFPTRTARGLAM